MKNQNTFLIFILVFVTTTFVKSLTISSSSNLAIQEVNANFEDHYTPLLTESKKLENITCPELNHTFTNEPPFDILGLPNCYDYIKPVLELYINDDNKTQCFMDVRNLPNANTSKCLQNLKSHKETQKVVIITHGFLNNFETKWLHKMQIAIQSIEKGTAVIILGWSIHGWCDLCHYPQNAANTRYVSQALFQIMDNLHTEFGRPLYTHCIGHSLGAHICGLTGKLLKSSSKTPNFNRISGMDPAGPYFFNNIPGYPHNVTSASRLDATDADFVDVIHTDGKVHKFWFLFMSVDFQQYGTLEPCGDVDFYPGSALTGYGCHQPGCTILQNIFKACSHARGHEYYMASIKEASCSADRICHGNPKRYPKNCTDLKKARNKVTMGYWTDINTIPGQYTVEVNSTSPYCLN